ncbi:MAG: tetratricopeptide repeat protein, partial [Methanosarcinaceae archaeon]|nr:tetratricopeptide repeat protein [Methanosarcinaceae archaeon]
VLLLSAVAFYALLPRLISQIHFLRAKNYTRQGNYGLAISRLEKAHDYQPMDSEILKQLGDVYNKLGERKSATREAFRLTEKAKDAYVRAALLNPLEVEIVYGLARTESRLEQLYQYLHPKDKANPYQPGPYFENTLRLRPNGILYNSAFARYLYQHNENDKFLGVIRTLVRIYPPSYNDLKEQPFWSIAVKEAVKDGLQQAIKEDISPKNTHKIMSTLLADDEEWDEAIAHYRESLLHQEVDNTSGDYIHLGRLYLKNRQPEEAELSFFHALDMTRERDKALRALYNIYKKEDYPERLYPFYQKAKRRFVFFPQMEIVTAQALINIKHYNQAQRILNELNDQEPTAEAYYWLARIYETEKDWDRMELAIQKATVLDPNNSHYRQIFISLLKRLGKIEMAEKQIGQTIENSDNPSSGLFTERAQLRWKREDYLGALKDWK